MKKLYWRSIHNNPSGRRWQAFAVITVNRGSPPPFQKLSQSFAQTSLFTVSCDIFPALVRFVSNFALSRSLSLSLAHPLYSSEHPSVLRSLHSVSLTHLSPLPTLFFILILIYPSLFSTSALFFFFSTPVSSIHILPPPPPPPTEPFFLLRSPILTPAATLTDMASMGVLLRTLLLFLKQGRFPYEEFTYITFLIFTEQPANH